MNAGKSRINQLNTIHVVKSNEDQNKNTLSITTPWMLLTKKVKSVIKKMM